MTRPTEDPPQFKTSARPVPEPTTLFMVANQDIYIDGLTRIISDQPGLKVIACTEPTSDCYIRYAENPTDILMVEDAVVRAKLETKQPEELFAQFLELRPQLGIIIFGHEITEGFIRQMLPLGVQGFIESSTSPERLAIAINEVHNGGYWLSRNVLSQLLQSTSGLDKVVEQHITGQVESMKNALTKRESDVLQRVLGGMLTREIANDLNLSEQSIKLHLSHLFKKFEVSTRSQLILKILKTVCPANNLIQLCRRTLDQNHVSQGHNPHSEDLPG